MELGNQSYYSLVECNFSVKERKINQNQRLTTSLDFWPLALTIILMERL